MKARKKVFLNALGVFLCLALPAFGQEVSFNLGEGGSLTETTMGLIALVTLLSIAPGLLIMVTCFPFVVTVMSILRQAIGLQQAPPGMLIVSLSLFLTYFVMEPVFVEAWATAFEPYSRGELGIRDAIPVALEPFRNFMAARTDGGTYSALAELRPGLEQVQLAAEAPLSLLVPSFLLSEIERAFQIGFILFLPFLVIDLVVAAVLMSMGMMMVPPAMVALPFKLAFFVVADGWTLISSALVRSYF